MDSQQGDGGESPNEQVHWGFEGVKVVVRVRPLSPTERTNPMISPIIEVLNRTTLTLERPLQSSIAAAASGLSRFSSQVAVAGKRYEFHQAFHVHHDQSDVFLGCTPIIYGAFQGINGAIMAYGTTGSGKTHTMFGSSSATGCRSAPGIVFQAVQEMFAEKQRQMERNPQKVIKFTCSFVEVYNEEVFDMLTAGCNRHKALAVREGPTPSETVIKGLTTEEPNSVEEFVDLVEQGMASRTCASTMANAQSSRSHAILTIEVEVREKAGCTKSSISKLQFCDLAGSERAAKMSISCGGNQTRLREGAKINDSLLGLSEVTQALAKRARLPPKSKIHIPWRRTMLTRMLKECLDGNSRTMMLICLSPSSAAYEETKNSIMFGLNAKEIRMTAKMNEYIANDKVITHEQAQTIEKQRLVIAALRESLRAKTGSCEVEGIDRETMKEFGLDGGGRQGSMFRRSPEQQQDAAPCSVPRVDSGWQECTPPSSSSAIVVAQNDNVTPRTVRLPSEACSTTVAATSMTGGAGLSSPPASIRAAPPPAQKYTEYRLIRDELEDIRRCKHSVESHIWKLESDIQRSDGLLRQKFMELARFESKRGGADSTTGSSHNVDALPIGIIKVQEAVTLIKEKRDASLIQVEQQKARLDELSHAIVAHRKGLEMKGSDFVLELLLDRNNATETLSCAEMMAKEYWAQVLQDRATIADLTKTLNQLVVDVKRIFPLVLEGKDRAPNFVEQCQLSLAEAKLATVENPADMVETYRRMLEDLGYCGHRGGRPRTQMPSGGALCGSNAVDTSISGSAPLHVACNNNSSTGGNSNALLGARKTLVSPKVAAAGGAPPGMMPSSAANALPFHRIASSTLSASPVAMQKKMKQMTGIISQSEKQAPPPGLPPRKPPIPTVAHRDPQRLSPPPPPPPAPLKKCTVPT